VLGGTVVLVLADRTCPAIEAARAAGIPTAVAVPTDHADRDAWDRAVRDALVGAGADVVVLAGFMRVLGPPVLERFAGRILNVHPSLLPAFPGRDAIRDALAAGVRTTGVTVHLVDATLDGGPIVFQEAVPILSEDDHGALAERIHAVEHRLLPRVVALALAGALRVEGPRVEVDADAAARLPRPRRALVSVSDKSGLDVLGQGLADLGFELVSTGGTARALRSADLAVTDVAAVTGVPEMLDGRVKTLHPRIAGGILADWRNADHRAQLAAAAIEPFELIVVNLYRFAEAAAKPGIGLDELIEEIDIGGPTLVRAAAKNHGSVGIVTDPASYSRVLTELRDRGALSDETRRGLALAAFRLTAAYDAAIAEELGRRLMASPNAPAASAASEAPSGAPEPMPERLDMELERAASLRYGENPHQAAALYRWRGSSPASGPFADGAAPLQGKELSYNNILDASAAAALCRDLRGAAAVIVKHGNPCGAAEATDLPEAWRRALAGDPISAFGGVAAIRGTVDAAMAELLTGLFLEVVVAPAFDDAARAILAVKANLRLLQDASILTAPAVTLEVRSAGGGVLATQSDTRPDDPSAWRTVTARAPTAGELRDLDLAWRICRRVSSNAIVLVRDGSLVGVGAGQMSRVDSARLAVSKAGPDRARGAACASDAFYPFPDGLEVCAEAGVTAFVQPGGSQRDAEVIAAADRLGAAMVLTGVRHFRH
jgi:phosphoribosylaminoimidazolecarboxamide formyltransferase/IMP cyclohydrolase